jgi:acetylornithine/N-succinyldiaminopimelate aminotransferase
MISSVLPTYARAPLSFVKGEGSWLITEDGTRYLDFGSGIAVNALGHANPILVDALKDQAENLWHTSNLYTIPNQEKLAAQLVEHTFADTVFFTNSGTESMECAVKMARKYQSSAGAENRVNVIAFKDSFHGRSMAMIAAAGAEKLTKGFGPVMPGFVHVDYGDLDAVEAAIDEETAAILVEPIQGEGGIIPAEDSFLQGLRALCDTHGLLLIYDEIQCGMGRTGKLFAHEFSGASPDIMAVAKGIGGGFPLGACLATEDAAKGMIAGSHGSTYGGNPLACAVGNAVVETIATPEFLNNVSRKAGYLNQRLEGLIADHPSVFSGVRGQGLMLGLQCVATNIDIVKAGYDAHLLTVPGAQNVIRLLPPLTISESEIDTAVERLGQAASAIEATLPKEA